MSESFVQSFRAGLRGQRLADLRLRHPQAYIALIEQILLDADDVAIRHGQVALCDSQDAEGAYQTERAADVLEGIRKRRIVRPA